MGVSVAVGGASSRLGFMESTGTHLDDWLSLRDAASLFGVSVDTLRRRIRDERLPEVELVQGQYGEEYRLPTAALGAVSEREGWALDLAVADSGGVTPGQDLGQALGMGIPAEILDRLLAAEGGTAGAVAELKAAESKMGTLEAQLQQARNDLEHERTENQRLRADLGESAKEAAVATARTEEIKARVADLERQITQAAGEREGLQAAVDASAVEVAEAAESNSVLTAQTAELASRIARRLYGVEAELQLA